MPMPCSLRWVPPLSLAMSLALLACGDHSPASSQPRDSQAAPASVLTTGPICPGCVAGGETSDFTGTQSSECSIFWLKDAVTLEQAEATGFDVSAARALLERRFSASFAWKLDRDFLPGDLDHDPGIVSGFTPETRVEGAIELPGTASYRHWDPARCDNGICTLTDGTRKNCGLGVLGVLLLDASVELQTADGALSLAQIPAQALLRLEPVTTVPLNFELDLSAVQGTLRLERQYPGPSRGTLYATLHARPEAIRGSLQPILGRVPSDAPATAGEDAYFRSLVGRWPAEDECLPHQLPVNEQTDAGREALGLFYQYYPDLALLAQQTPVSGTWTYPVTPAPPLGFVNPGSVSLGFAVSSDAQPLCTDGDASLTLSTQARVSSADGSLNWTTAVKGFVRVGEGNGSTSDPPSLDMSATVFFQDADALRSAGLGDVDFLGGTPARVQLDAAFFAFPDHVGHTASLGISSVIPCATPPRCSEQEPAMCQFCGTSFRLRWLDSPSAF
jgi:hypothetical protein